MRDTFLSYRRGGAVGWVVGILLLIMLVVMLFPKILRPPIPNVKQKVQFHSLEAPLEFFDHQFGRYPPSDATDDQGQPYCGAMKLAEALMGQDRMGFHPDSAFRLDGADPNTGDLLYTTQTLAARPGAFLPLEQANIYRLREIYGDMHTGPFRGDVYVLCDTYERKLPSGVKAGMPILYFRADTNGRSHDPNASDNIYNWKDNLALLKLGVPGDPNAVHPLTDSKRFYLNTRNEKIASESRPYRADSYILLSAGFDGLYGTPDDILNFDWQYRER